MNGSRHAFSNGRGPIHRVMCFFLVPMLENAGANVLLLERDYNKWNYCWCDESIGGKSTYKETNGKEKGEHRNSRFYQSRKNVHSYEIHFEWVRQEQFVQLAKERVFNMELRHSRKLNMGSMFYQTLKIAATMHYIYIHAGEDRFGWTSRWGRNMDLLGYSTLKGFNTKITLSQSSQDGKVVSADAVKIGGGMALLEYLIRVLNGKHQ